MKGLPDSDIYERELHYMPYRNSWEAVLTYVKQHAPKGGRVLDLMCGPGFLLGKIKEIRPDLELFGVDIDERYVAHSKEKYPEIHFEQGDVLTWSPPHPFDVVLCTGSIHHLPYERQEDFVKRIPSMITQGGFSILSDCHVDDYSNEQERKIAAATLGFEYLKKTIENGADDEVIHETSEILDNDVMMKEFKTSVKKRLPIYQKYFSSVQVNKTWPLDKETEYGDYWMICKN